MPLTQPPPGIHSRSLKAARGKPIALLWDPKLLKYRMADA
jgi:hypothetical protein